MTKQQIEKRATVLKAMDTIAKLVQNEDVFEIWLDFGIPNGTIDEKTMPEDLEELCDNESMLDIMYTFQKLIKRADKNGGLYLFDGEEGLMTE